ncbi:hypothetical protein CAPTEDRAFT_149244 [Capitella teleta]|uniref:Fibrinogen C-terminal domain-containing protein n=1 Tax=Capitella teleta TaxID=283909 RepID=R7ULI5_CAPTE|nr:hypothetical protein CAPTEDRAFT_149244 [Capitella teleta]|eukprot:ELU04132.1 hypothetical protein CAPTEDRAFT_149244 [Capitella teleta]
MNVAYADSPHVCNNATFTWLLGTVLEQVSKQTEGLNEQRQELVAAQELANECTGQISGVLSDLDAKNKAVEDLEAQKADLEKRNAALWEELEQLSTQEAHLHIRPKDCADVLRYGYRHSGIYTVYPLGYEEQGFPVFCDLNSEGGGWLVFQRRQDGSQSFARDWDTYKHGFGILAREFWLGNDKLHALTSQRKYELRVELVDFNGEQFHATYSDFSVDNENALYRLHVGAYEGDAGDSLAHHNDAPFGTVERDHDLSRSGNCAELYGHGGWWWVRCYDSNMNGVYGNKAAKEAIVWYRLHQNHEPMRHVEMKLRPMK